MNISLLTTDLKKLVKKLAAIQSQNIELGNNQLFAFDGDMGIIVKGPFEESLIVNSRLFSSTCNKLSGTVSFSKSGGPLVIKAGKFKAELPVVQSQPTPTPLRPESELSIEAKELTDLLTFASSVTDEKSTVDHTGSIQLVADKMGLKVTATDNLRIATTSNAFCYHPGLSILIPSKIVRSIKDLEGMVRIGQTEKAIFFWDENTTVFTRKFSKKFPDVNRVIPTTYKLEVEVKIQELIEALQRLAVTLDPETNNKILLNFEGDKLHLQTGNSSIGQSEDEVEIIPLVPDPFEGTFCLTIGANLVFLIQGLTSLGKDGIVVFKANDSSKPFTLESKNRKLIMAGIRI